jgi:hypothetical protein
VRYEAAGAPIAVYVCHCRECQKQSASAFGISVSMRRADFRVTRGKPKFWERATDSGGRCNCAFCPVCGSRLWHERSAAPDTVSIKGGSLDEPPDLGRAVHIWTKRKLAGVAIPENCVQYTGEPPD